MDDSQNQSQLQFLLTVVQNLVQALNALTETVQMALVNIYDPGGDNA